MVVSTPPAPPLPDELAAPLRGQMRLPYPRNAAPEVLATARAQRWEPAETLRVPLAEEVHGLRRGHPPATTAHRRATPPGRPSRPWREADSCIPARTQQAPASLEWITRAENLAVTGPSGTGKTHFIEALVHAAIDTGRQLAWFTLESLTAALHRAAADGSTSRTITKITRADLIVVDDIGMPPAGQAAAEALYRLIDAAYERRSVAVTSNLHPLRIRHHHAQNLGCALASRFHAKARTDAIRRHLITVPARIAHRARHLTLHLPEGWAQADAFDALFTTTHTPPIAPDHPTRPPQRGRPKPHRGKAGQTSGSPTPNPMISKPNLDHSVINKEFSRWIQASTVRVCNQGSDTDTRPAVDRRTGHGVVFLPGQPLRGG